MENNEMIKDIIEEALTDSWIDKRTGEHFKVIPDYDINNGIVHIYTPVKPYKLVVLRRLLYIAKIQYQNIIVGNPDV